MPDENGTEATRSDTPSADESLFGDAANEAPATVADEQDSNEETEQGQQGPDDAEQEAGAPDELKVVVSIKGGRATIGVQQPSSDPHIESFDDADLSGLAQETPAVVERARARWEEAPKHPAYARPAPPARSRNRRGQGTAQDATAEGEAAEAQQQTLRLF